MSNQKKVIITGSSGFIGSHLVRKLKKEGNFVIGIDIEQPKYEKPHLFFNYDLRDPVLTKRAFSGCEEITEISEVYNLACLMGGMGYIGDTKHSHDVMTGSTLILANVLDACIKYKVKKYFYSSSACVYNMNFQEEEFSPMLREEMAIPAQPDLMYGWQKLMGELMAQAAYEQYGLDIRIARFHNIFGIEGIWDGGKEKAPAAISRKVATAKDGDVISVWGDGKQRRSFLYIDECLTGVEKLMNSICTQPLNIGSSQDVSITELTDMLIDISGKKLKIEYDLSKPQGVRGRNSDNQLIFEKLGWMPTSQLYDGLVKTYNFINKQVNG